MDKQTRRATHLARLVTAAAMAAGLLAACGGGSAGAGPAADAATQTPSTPTAAASSETAAQSAGTAVALGRNSSSASTVAQPRNTEGRLLASNCFQCHGTLGTGGFDAIRGKDAGELLEFMRKPAGSDIMAAHAQGYTTAQLQKIIAYLQQ
jgi:mono/diheme cytochrome c family protein